MLILRIHVGAASPFRIPIDGVLNIGRESTNEVILVGSTVSRRHARLTPSEGGVLLRDLGSRNGTIVRGVKIGEVHLQAGDHFCVGDTNCDLETATEEELESSAVSVSLSTRKGSDEITSDP